MNGKQGFHAVLPYAVPTLLFLILAFFYFSPQLGGKSLPMHDYTQYVGMSHDIEAHIQKYGEDPQWTGNSFSGMPSYMIDFKYPTLLVKNAVSPLLKLIGNPAAMTFLAMFGFWLMLLLWGVNPWLGIVPAVAYGFSTYSILIIGAGHISKMWAMAYAPMLIGAVVYTFRSRKMWLGAILAALFASLEIGANHPQITYYFLLVILAFWINEFIREYRSRTLAHFGKATAMLLLAAVLAVGSNFAPLYYTIHHTADTTRGGSELAVEDESGKSRGLDLEYATAWSYGRAESFNLLIPNLMGGASDRGFSPEGEVGDALAPYGARRLAESLPGYWGDQPMTAGPTYLGAVVLFLAVLGLFLLEGSRKWWLLIVSVLALFLSWGSNMMWFTELCFKVLPGYNKFRAVSMALVVVQWSVPLLAALILARLWKAQLSKERLLYGVKWAVLITGGVALFFALFGGKLFDFSSAVDTQLPQEVAAAMRGERAQMLRADAWRSLFFVIATAAVILWFGFGKIKRGTMTALLALLVCLDLIPVDQRFLSRDKFINGSNAEIKPTEADLSILADTTPGYRVANFSVSPFNDATTSYFHRSVGGYHGAKLRRYQDLIDRYLSRMHQETYNMLNTKYFIVSDPNTGALNVERNPEANGAAWFVERVVWATDAKEEIAVLDTLHTRRVAVVDKSFEKLLAGVELVFDSAATIQLVEYRPNYLKYEYEAPLDGVAVFSEIYYDKGWKAFVDGEEVPYFRADYVLRAMALPAGRHSVEFRFAAPNYGFVATVTLVCSLLIFAGLAAAVVVTVLNERKTKRKNGVSGE